MTSIQAADANNSYEADKPWSVDSGYRPLVAARLRFSLSIVSQHTRACCTGLCFVVLLVHEVTR